MVKSSKRGSKSTKLAAAKDGITKVSAEGKIIDKGKGKGKVTVNVSDELRQAVMDLGGNEEDLELIAGVDSDDEVDEPVSGAASASKGQGKSDEKDLKKALGEFMKGLDFASIAPAASAADTDEEDEGEEEEEEDEDEQSDSQEDDDEEHDDEEEGDEVDEANESSEDEQVSPSEEESEAEEDSTMPKPSAVVPSVEVKPEKAPPADPDQHSGSKVPRAPIWTTLLPELPPPSQPLEPLQPFKAQGLRSKANQLLETLPPLTRAGSSSDAAFISQILSSGTHQDKLSALILIVRESPTHAVKELNRLRSMTGWKEDGTVGGGGNKDQRVAVVKALADWWVTGGGKENGKLKYFADQPLLAHPDLTDRHLLVFAFEDYMKRWFFNLLQVLEALHIVFRLLSGNAEQEQNLLRLGVNKLGDADRAVASKTQHHLLQLLQIHPAMKAVVAREVSAIVLKPVASQAGSSSGAHVRFDEPATPAAKEKTEAMSHGRYYGLITLNQITLTPKDEDVAGKLVELYFEVFRELLGDHSEDEKPTGEGEELDTSKVEKVAGKVERWRGRRKGAKPKGGRKTATENEELVDNGHARLVAAVLTGINRALPYAKLDEAMFAKYMDSLFKITHAGTFNTSIQALTLIFQICQSRSTVSDRFYRTLYESLYDTRLITSSKQAMYLNLFCKALKADTNQSRVMAFVKRLLQMLGLQQPPFICGAIYLLGELFASTPGLKRMLIEPEDDGEEHFVDADENGNKPESSKAVKSETEYDGKKREPQFAHADSSCLWDLVPLVNHFHPSVSLQATQLLLSQPITGSSDISLNTLVSFLDRFVYRNPKKTLQPKGASIMQPAAASDSTGMIVNKKGARSTDGGYVNSEAFWRKKIEDVPADQLFFHKFFSSKLAQKESAKKKAGKAESDLDEDEDEDEDGSMSGEELPSEIADENGEDDEEITGGAEEEEEDSDPEEAEIWRAMKASMPDAGDDMGISDDSDDDELEMEEGDEDDEDEEEVDGAAEDNSEGDEASEDEDEEADSDVAEEQVTKLGGKSSKKGKGKGKARSISPDSGSEAGFDFADEDDDILSLDEMPDIQLDPDHVDLEEEEEEDEVEKGKRKRRDERKERKKKRKEMPLFASYEDYRALIDAGGSEEE